MLVKSKLVIAAALFLSAASVAQAGKDVDPEATGGFVWGPMGQRMGGSAVNPAYHRSLGGKRYEYGVTREGSRAYGYGPSTRFRYQRNDYDYWGR
jgi:hypothetical protein